MIFRFPNLETLQLSIAGGLIPADMALSAAKVAFVENGSILVESSVKLNKKAATDLSKLNVTGTSKLPENAESMTCWPQILPLKKLASPPVLASQSAVLFELESKDLAVLVGEIVRLGNDRLSYRWLPDNRVSLRVVGPPYYTLLRAIDDLPAIDTGPILAFVEQAPRIWVPYGYSHPIGNELQLPDEEHLLIRPNRKWDFLDKTPFADIYELLEFPLPAQPITWHGDANPAKMDVPLRLTAGNLVGHATLWVLRGNATEQLDRFVRDIDDQLVHRLRFAVADHRGERVLILREIPSKLDPPALPIESAQGFRAYHNLPNLYLPVGKRLHPQLRRDAVRKLLANDPNQVVWLNPATFGEFTPESISEDAFRPLEEWVEYQIEQAHEPLKAWIESTTFDFAQFVCDDNKPAKPKAPGAPPERIRETDAPATEAVVPSGEPRATFAPVEAGPEVVNVWKQRRSELEAAFLDIVGPLNQPKRLELWPLLAEANVGVGDLGEAALCWLNLIWAGERSDPKVALAWMQAETGMSDSHLSPIVVEHIIAKDEPTLAELRQFLSTVLVASLVKAQWLPKIHKNIVQYLEQHEVKLPIRAVWLTYLHLFRACGSDVLGLARVRDRILQRLLEQGLNATVEIPFFIRTSGKQGSDTVRMVRDAMLRLHPIVRNWAETGAKYGEPSGTQQTGLYVDLIFAFGLARIGEIPEAERLKAAAERMLGDLSLQTDLGIATQFLCEAFCYRINRAIVGQSTMEPLPESMVEWLRLLESTSRGTINSHEGSALYVINRMQKESEILDVHYRRNPYANQFKQTAKGLRVQLYALADIVEPTVMAKKAREVFRSANDAKERFEVLHDVTQYIGRAGADVTLELLSQIPKNLSIEFDTVGQGELIERGLFLAAHFGDETRLQELIECFLKLLPQFPDHQRFDLINAAFARCLHGMKRYGAGPEIETLLVQVETAVYRGKTIEDLIEQYNRDTTLRFKFLRCCLNVATGWSSLGSHEKAQKALEITFNTIVSNEPLVSSVYVKALAELTANYVTAVTYGNASKSIQLIVNLFDSMPAHAITNGYTTSRFYSRSHLLIVEALVLGMVRDDFNLGETARHWLEEDEFFIRKRIHRETKTLVATGRV